MPLVIKLWITFIFSFIILMHSSVTIKSMCCFYYSVRFFQVQAISDTKCLSCFLNSIYVCSREWWEFESDLESSQCFIKAWKGSSGKSVINEIGSLEMKSKETSPRGTDFRKIMQCRLEVAESQLKRSL